MKRSTTIGRNRIESAVISSCRIILAALVPAASISPSLADESYHVRTYTAAQGLSDSYATAITWSPRGNVWVKHRETDEISVLDGYNVQTLSSPGRDNYRVYESRTGQVWSLYPDGLAQYIANQWFHYFVREIRTEIQSHPLRRVRQIPLVPAEHNRVLFLLSDQLMDYDSAQKKTRELKNVNDTGLGKFIEMTEARDGGLWITGATGLAKVEGPLRQISSKSDWRIEVVGNLLEVANLQRPFEDEQNSIATVASDMRTSNQRVLLRFDGVNWTRTEVPDENILQAWPGWDQDTWGYTINSLLRFVSDGPPGQTHVRISTEQHRDAAIEANDAFWLATSEGVVRYAPNLWRRPDDLSEVSSPVYAALESRDGALWFANTDSLIVLRDEVWKKIEWPNGFEADQKTIDRLYQLPDDRIVIAGGTRALLFKPTSDAFESVPHPEQRRVKILGQSKPGQLWVQTSPDAQEFEESFRLEQFNGSQFIPVEFGPNVEISRSLDFIFATRNDDVWFVSSGEITRLHNGQIEMYGDSEGFYGYRASCFLEIDEARTWFGGAGKILEFDGEKWSVIRSGLDHITRMLRSSSGAIWVATSRGLHSYLDGSWVSNGVEEGLTSPVATELLEDRKGRLWSGSHRGISLYHANADRDPPETLSPELLNSGNPSGSGLTAFRLNAVDKWNYTKPDRLLYSFRIDESPWSSYTNTATASFENLRAGKHRFEVRAMDRNWNRDIATTFLNFSVIIPWHKEPRILAVLICGLILVVFFAGLAVNRHLQLIRSYAEVENIVGIRTRELEEANQELIHSQKMRALGTLAAGISHDFNNILSIIKGSAQLIENHIHDQDKIRTRVDRIKTMVDQGTGIVKSILGLSRATNEALRKHDLNSLATETVKLLGDEFLHTISIRFEPKPSLPCVLGVKEMIQQMLLNLLLNAADAMSGAGEITMKTTQTHRLPESLALSPNESPNYVLLIIGDSGCGITEQLLPRIFEPFFTTKALSTRRGTGLGLTMVYELAKELGYGLQVDSTLGKGTTFTIIAPAQ